MQRHSYILISILFLFASCARQTSPTGGPKDTIPPTLTSAYPKAEQLNYKERNIVLTFNESIMLENPKEQIIITPDIGKDYKITSRKNKVILELDKDLADSTTYLISFRDAVKDLTEKNPVTNLKLAFSTGSYIDSLSIRGTVLILKDGTPAKDATVSLYLSDTFDIFKHKPIYLTKTNDKGEFIIENLKPANYFIYAYLDKNKNLLVDSKTEQYGFLADTIKLSTNIRGLQIPLISLDVRPLKFSSGRPYNTYFNLKTSKNLAWYSIQNADQRVYSTFGEDRANIRVYNSNPNVDSFRIRFQARDSINNFIDTTLYATFSKREVKKEGFMSSLKDLQVLGNGMITYNITFNKPINEIVFDSIVYHIDSLNQIRFGLADLTYDTLNNKIYFFKTIDKKLLIKPTTNLTKDVPPNKLISEMRIGRGAFISIEQDSSKQSSEVSRPLEYEQAGIAIVQLKTDETNPIIQLLEKDNVIRVVKNKAQHTFDYLKPGTYRIRLIIDKNKDGKWTAGNFYLRQEPEQIVYFLTEKKLQEVNLKANWEVGPLLITYP